MPPKSKLRTSSETDIQRLAREWIDALSDPNGLKGSWRLQVLEERIRMAKETVEVNGVPVEREVPERRPSRLVRFAKGCPWNLVAEAEKYLLSQAPYTGRIANGIVFDGVYRPTRTRWIRDDQTSVDDQRRATNENRHTLVQDLVETSAAGDGDGVTTSDDCVETVSTEYHWDEPSVPDASSLPLSGQGVTVSVQQVARQEDGTYRYAIVTRTAKTRIGAEVTVECTEFQTVTQCDCVNLFGDPSDAFDGRVPVPCSAAQGTTVEWRNLKQNDDCTWNVTILKTVAKSIVSDKVTSKTLTEERSTVKTAAEASELAPAPAPANGVTYEHRSEKRPDGKFDNTVSARTAVAVPEQVTELRRTVRGVTTRTVNRNQASAATLPQGTEIGTVVNTKTEAGLYDQDITTVAQGEEITAGEGCAKTLYEHSHTARKVQADMPTGDVAAPGGGTHVERESRITEEGSFDVTTRTVTEQEVNKAQVTLRKTLRGTQKTTVNRNVASALPETNLAVGEVRQSEKTPGGLYTTTKTEITTETAGVIGKETRKTKFEETSSTVTNQDRQGADASSAGNGKVNRVSSRRTEEGTWDVTQETSTEVGQNGAQKTWRKTARGTQTTTVDRNAGTALTSSGLPVGGTRTTELTPGGLYNNTTVTFTPATNQTVGLDKQRTVFEETDSETKVQSQSDGNVSTAGNGKTYRKSSRLNDEGTWDVSSQSITEKEKTGATKSWRKTLRGVQETTVDRNSKTALSGSNLKVGETRTSEVTPGGLYNNTTVTTTASGAGSVGTECQKTVFEHIHSQTVNQQSAPTEHIANAGGGVVRRQSARQTEEGTWDVVTQTTEEQAQEGAQKTWRRTLRGTQETVVNRNVDSPLNGAGIAVGETRQSEKTPGGKYTNTTGTSTPLNADLSEASAVTAGETSTVSVKASSRKPTSPSLVTVPNQEKRWAARGNDAGGWDEETTVVVHKELTTGRIVAGSVDREVEVQADVNASLPSVGLIGTNEEVDISANPNTYGSFTVQKRKTKFKKRSVRATSETPTLRLDVVTTVNDESEPSAHEASATPNEHGSQTTRTVTRTPKPMSSGWITWTSKEKLVRATYKYEHGLLIFVNQDRVPSVLSGKNCQVNARINQDGKYDGTITYKQLTSWEINSGSSGGGGSETGYISATLYDPKTNTWKKKSIHVRTYWGAGNEGSEAKTRATQKMYTGLHLPPRTYALNITDDTAE